MREKKSSTTVSTFENESFAGYSWVVVETGILESKRKLLNRKIFTKKACKTQMSLTHSPPNYRKEIKNIGREVTWSMKQFSTLLCCTPRHLPNSVEASHLRVKPGIFLKTPRQQISTKSRAASLADHCCPKIETSCIRRYTCITWLVVSLSQE